MTMESTQSLSEYQDNDKSQNNSIATETSTYVVLGETYKHSGDELSDNSVMQTEQGNKVNENINNDIELLLNGSRAGFLNQWFSSHKPNMTISDLPFLFDIYSKINFTYRTKFSPIERSPDGPSPINFQLVFRENPLNVLENALMSPDCFNTDIGWGCMIRTGQSLLANTIQRIKKGRQFRISDSNDDKDITNMFKDSYDAPFSLHKFVESGKTLSNMKPGQWFGPSATSRSIQHLVTEFPQCNIDKCIVSISSGDIPKEELDNTYKEKSDCKVLILLGVKLGIDSVNQYYWEDILKLLSTKFSVGIAGGRPSSSLYFFGYERSMRENENDTSQLLYFDPHTAQPALGHDGFKTCHSVTYGKLPLKDLDPSMLIGILLENNDDWLVLQEFATTCKIFNLISTNMETVNFDDSNIDIESLESDNSIEDEETYESRMSRGEENLFGHYKSAGELSNGCSNLQPSRSIATDYVDIGPLMYHTPESLNETFENIQCKKQKIIIYDEDKSFDRIKETDIEIERVLVETEHIESSPIS